MLCLQLRDMTVTLFRIEGNVSYYDHMSWITYLYPRVDVIVCVADSIRRYFWNMKILGFPAPVKKAAAIIKSCDICILPAIKREGLPKGIIEGMIQNVAPIVTDSGGSPELIEHGKSGLIVRSGSAQDIADAIERLFNDRELLCLMKANAKARIVNNFHTSKTVKQHTELYKQLSVGT
jgi:glycosyltransferase involved in cell wall biosynthesis